MRKYARTEGISIRPAHLECVIRKRSIYEKVLHSSYVALVLDTDVEPTMLASGACLTWYLLFLIHITQ